MLMPRSKFTWACRITTIRLDLTTASATAMAGTRTGYYYGRGRLSCGEARRIVRNNGFRNVATIECNGRTYTFEATRRGRDVTVFVNSRTGRHLARLTNHFDASAGSARAR